MRPMYRVDHPGFTYRWTKKPLTNLRYMWQAYIKGRRQRARYGLALTDAWNLDNYICEVLANGLILLAGGHSVSNHYVDAANGDVNEGAKLARADYLRMADILHRYGTKDSWTDKASAEKFGGCTEDEIDEALKWVFEHFRSLWD